jgi:hypothetical protein
MTARDRPLILVAELECLATLSRAALADIIVTTVDGHGATELHAGLFARYPGLTLALIVGDPSTVYCGSREGRVLRVQTAAQVSIRSRWLRALAVELYAERVRRAGRPTRLARR